MFNRTHGSASGSTAEPLSQRFNRLTSLEQTQNLQMIFLLWRELYQKCVTEFDDKFHYYFMFCFFHDHDYLEGLFLAFLPFQFEFLCC